MTGVNFTERCPLSKRLCFFPPAAPPKERDLTLTKPQSFQFRRRANLPVPVFTPTELICPRPSEKRAKPERLPFPLSLITQPVSIILLNICTIIVIGTVAPPPQPLCPSITGGANSCINSDCLSLSHKHFLPLYSFGIKRKAISILLEIQKSADSPLMPALFFISIIYKILSAALLFLLA